MICVFFFQAEDGIRVFFFFQAEDGIRDIGVTGVQTCALPILGSTLAQLTSKWAAKNTNSENFVVKF